MKTMSSVNSKQGLVAILDALGASHFGEKEIRRFMDARAQVIALLHQKAEEVLSEITEAKINTFTFNDTILVTCEAGRKAPSLKQITHFLLVIRKFVVDSLSHGLLFRGSVSIGNFYTNDETNTVLGEAISDAAAWYEKADWLGVHCTPRCSLIVAAHLSRSGKNRNYVVLDYPVPLKDSRSVRVKAVNWPRVFMIPHLNSWHSADKPKAKLLELLSAHKIPLGTEGKYENTIAFFDYSLKEKTESDKERKNG